MKLYYRGVSYEYDSIKAGSRKIGEAFKQVREFGPAYNLIYRGNSYRVDPNVKPAEVPVARASYKLIYRGVTYLVNRSVQGEVSVVSQLANLSKYENRSLNHSLRFQK